MSNVLLTYGTKVHEAGKASDAASAAMLAVFQHYATRTGAILRDDYARAVASDSPGAQVLRDMFGGKASSDSMPVSRASSLVGLSGAITDYTVTVDRWDGETVGHALARWKKIKSAVVEYCQGDAPTLSGIADLPLPGEGKSAPSFDLEKRAAKLVADAVKAGLSRDAVRDAVTRATAGE